MKILNCIKSFCYPNGVSLSHIKLIHRLYSREYFIVKQVRSSPGFGQDCILILNDVAQIFKFQTVDLRGITCSQLKGFNVFPLMMPSSNNLSLY